jgi:hypothetical protein
VGLPLDYGRLRKRYSEDAWWADMRGDVSGPEASDDPPPWKALPVNPTDGITSTATLVGAFNPLTNGFLYE